MSESEKNRSIPRLRCYAEMESDGSWFAICLDLNIYARSSGLSEVRESLNNLVADYIDEAYGKDRAYFSDLVPRRAPNYFFVRCYYLRVRSLIFGALFSAEVPDNGQKPGFRMTRLLNNKQLNSLIFKGKSPDHFSPKNIAPLSTGT